MGRGAGVIIPDDPIEAEEDKFGPLAPKIEACMGELRWAEAYGGVKFGVKAIFLRQ